MWKTYLTLALIGLMVLALGCTDDDNRNKTPIGPDTENWQISAEGWPFSIRGMAASSQRIVAVSDYGRIHTSEDGLTWTQRSSAMTDRVQSVVWTGTEFIASDRSGAMCTSPDGISWTTVVLTGDVPAGFSRLAFNDTLLLCTDVNNRSIFSSDDGEHWISRYLDSGTYIHNIAWCDTMWVAVGYPSVILTSTNAIDWTNRGFYGLDRFQSVCRGDSGIVVGGPTAGVLAGIWHSSDGITWEQQFATTDCNMRHISWTGTEYVALGQPILFFGDTTTTRILRSTNGVNWQSSDSHISGGVLEASAIFKGDLYVGGGNGFILRGNQASNLEIISSGSSFTDLVWTGSQYVGVSWQGSVLRSDDGHTWSERSSHAAAMFQHLAASDSRLVATGTDILMDSLGTNQLFASTDGSAWAKVWTGYHNTLTNVVWLRDRFVALGNHGLVLTSSDGLTWLEDKLATDQWLTHAVYANGEFYVYGQDSVWTSPDGEVWTGSGYTNPEGLIFRGIVYADDIHKFVATGMDRSFGYTRYVMTSDDGLVWSSKSLGALGWLVDIAWTGENLIACGVHGGITESEDGITWSDAEALTGYSLNCIAVGTDKQVVIAGDSRTVIVSQ
ncbi:MAG: hypothetical protein KKA42_16290 [candidate division Zixibacteria bacterium]|nr:hypothetical protein [candidate division Zixibacteria bacterium]